MAFFGVTMPRLKWQASPNFDRGRSSKITLIVIHDTEGGYAGSISWFAQSASQVSAHFVLREDGAEATQMVRLADKAWHVAAFNSEAVGIEMAGYAAKGFAPAQLRKAARLAAYLCKRLGIPPKLSYGSTPGVTFHQLLGEAGGGHHDPGFSEAQMKMFVALVKNEYDRGRFSPLWRFRIR